MATALVTRAEAEDKKDKKDKHALPPAVAEARDELVVAAEALAKGIARGEEPEIDRGSLRAGDRRMKHSWSAFGGWLDSRGRLQSVSKAKKEALARLESELLPTDLKWMRGATYQEMWGETTRRLQRVPANELAAADAACLRAASRVPRSRPRLRACPGARL